ncbi:MAG: hypothetical protein AAB426_10560 [Myxococcota bacterium]
MQIRTWVALGGLSVAVAMAAASSCSGLRNQCTDRVDNDGDGYVDRDDPACAIAWDSPRYNAELANCTQSGVGLETTNPACQTDANGAGVGESDDPDCFDRKDNDDDGFVDWPDDLGCADRFGEHEENGECADGEDNDGDHLVDAQDPACRDELGDYDAYRTSEAADPACADGYDNDGDGKSDYPNDVGCESSYDASERNPQCSDGVDNDGDGRKDFPSDPDCLSGLQDREAAYACHDRVDNDRDGQTDFPADIGCASVVDDDESNPQCADGADNDGDGKVDFGAGANNDAGCTSLRDNSETEPACSDGLDNDGDGLTDYPNDLGCESPEDVAEVDSECADGIDNDGDGLTDFPNDPQCINVSGSSEQGTAACSDGIDNDGDGLADYPTDPQCTGRTDTTESAGLGDCADGIDNDDDGFFDTTLGTRNDGDPACDAGYVWERLDPACDDGRDNDGDGRADYAGVDLNHDGAFDLAGELPPDPGCPDAWHYSESPKPQCSDGLDNDGDGTADWGGVDTTGDGAVDVPADAGCANADALAGQRDRNEADPAQCDDGIDNDGDLLIDFQPEFLVGGAPNPAYLTGDPQCESIFDNGEGT